MSGARAIDGPASETHSHAGKRWNERGRDQELQRLDHRIGPSRSMSATGDRMRKPAMGAHAKNTKPWKKSRRLPDISMLLTPRPG